jgi:hypothetical protein
MSIQISGSNLTTGLNNTVLSAPYGSLSFNGQNQSVLTSGTGSGANGTILDLTTGAPNWTIEFWIYSSQHSRNAVPQYFLNQGNGQNVVFSLIASESVSGFTQNYNCIQFAFYSTTLGWVYMNSWPTALSLNTWYHVAVSKDTTSGNRYYLYLNGVLVSATPNISNPQVNNGQSYEMGFPVNYLTGDNQYAFNGLLSNIRIVKGVALYVTPNVTVPTPPLASTQSLNLSGFNQAITGTQTSLLLTTPNNASYLTDTSSYAQTVTGVNNPTSSSLGPDTYTGSILFNGTNQYLTVPAATQFNYSTNDFTWEMWIYPTATTWTSGAFYLIDHGPSANQGSLHYNSNKLVYYNYYNAQTIPPYTAAVAYPSLYTISGGSIAANTWTHVAVCRQNLVTRMFINGKLVSSGPDPYDYAVQSSSPFTLPPVVPATQSVTIGARSDSGIPFKGNISNIRIVNGVSIYNVGNFTPPVRPLPPVQVPNEIGSPSKAIFGSQTSLLMNTSYNNGFLTDSSFNQVTLNQVTTGVFPPSTYTMTSNSPNPFNSNGSIFTPGSIFFNGSSQYLNTPASSEFTLSTNDFTVEFWIFITAFTPTAFRPISQGTYAAGEFLLVVYDNGGFDWCGSTTPIISGSILTDTFRAGFWQHVAICRSGTDMAFYVNGVSKGTATSSYNFSGATSVYIGGNPSTSSQYLNGFMSNVRIVQGAAAYTQSFIPTSGPFTTSQTFNQSGIPSCPVQSSQTSLLLTTPSNSSFLTDSSTNAFTVTNNGTATSEPFNPFTGNYEILANPGSVQLNGSSQYATYAVNSNIAVAANQPFTVEFWIYTPTQVQTAPAIFSTTNNGGQSGHMAFFVGHAGLGIANQYGLYWVGMPTGTGGGGTTTNLLTSTTNYITNTWTHIAIVRSGTSAVTMYINGVANATVTYNGAVVFPTNTIWVGTSGDNLAASSYTGYISNFRWVNGVAVYTANFVTPPGPLNNSQAVNQSGAPSAAVTSSQTSLLLNTAFGTNFLVDGSINNFIGTNVGTATSATLDPFVF